VKVGDVVVLVETVNPVPVPFLFNIPWKKVVDDPQFYNRYRLTITLVQGNNCNAPIADEFPKPGTFVPQDTPITLILSGGGTKVCYTK